ncbi:MAG: hypothetical protein UT86_C0002G0108 [Candidatus Magasanikbacteria bacterium GW2011_GWC2_40_17]|uniref:Uncharacterized protein n=1 Tax=Candidatus Magasanikbacteria bacterium GW2011_GWA2_42_32 TaxID=1619039 RepID=A0A0G1A8M1_9BACT|nr:MAG: hypothetical protein UT86_C0002G0108 [Candidatus Magasanikbacteria bacterium GW2011_GWC2_40_17]KKS57269.1 MAG: hypothetical protein UV20_C0002G0058 [Candidatus Magasanikbacteria bacterium GW2011_GWA2_42_32]OGH86158.1 MAG: hypothetical protein A2294_02800 [Candidatus Magasanikbacteria bacterium RIFOXYB2_FULL_38_10]
MHGLIIALFVAMGLGLSSTGWALFSFLTPGAREGSAFLEVLMKMCLVFGLPLLLVSTYCLYGPFSQAFKSNFLFPLGLFSFTMALSQFLYILWEARQLNKFLTIAPLFQKSQPNLAQTTIKWISKTFVVSIALGSTCFVLVLVDFFVTII